MNRVILINELPKLVDNLQKQHKKVVLVGGCFDVLHPGHVIFLEKAKAEGEILIIILESDQKIKQEKGQDRPVHNQQERATVLSAIRFVDFIIMLPTVFQDAEYDALIGQIKPNVIAATESDPGIYHKQRIAKLVGAQLKLVTKVVGGYSSSSILNKQS